MKIEMKDIPYNLHSMVDIIGVEKFLDVARLYGGSTVYIPVHNKVVMGERNREIVKAYNGRNIDKLRLRYGMSEQQVRRVLSKEGSLKN